MRILVCLVICLSASPAAAHPGHLADLAGHDHWVAGIAIGIAIAIGLAGALAGKTDEDASDQDEEEGEEAAA